MSFQWFALFFAVGFAMMVAAAQQLAPAAREFWELVFAGGWGLAAFALAAYFVRDSGRFASREPEMSKARPPGNHGASVGGGHFEIKNCSFMFNAGDGLHIEDGTASIENTKAEGNGGHGVFAKSSGSSPPNPTPPEPGRTDNRSRGIVLAGKGGRIGSALVEGYDIGIEMSGENNTIGTAHIKPTDKK